MTRIDQRIDPPLPSSRPAIWVKGLTKRYGKTLALHGLTFSVEQGQILGLLGPNGAGVKAGVYLSR